MNRSRLAVLIASAGTLLSLFAGCGPKKTPTHVTPPAQHSEVAFDQRMSELQRESASLASVTKQLPGRDPKQDRQLVADAFDRTSESLVLLGGPSPVGTYRQVLMIVDSVRHRLRSLSADV